MKSINFNNNYCLTVDDERYNYLSNVFKYYDIKVPTKHIGVLNDNHKDIKKSENFCYIGHLSLVMMARTLELPYIIIFEDDAYPRKDIKDKLNYYLNDIPSDCGILFFGTNTIGDFIKIDDKFSYVNSKVCGAHSYVVFKDAYDDYINSLCKIKISDMAIVQENFKTKILVTNEQLFIQKNINHKSMSILCTKINRYIFPDRNNKGKINFSLIPMDGFEDYITDVYEPELAYIIDKNAKDFCTIDIKENVLWHRGNKFKLYNENNKQYLLCVDGSFVRKSELVKCGEENSINIYKIV